MKNLLACAFAVVGFSPTGETGELGNVGVVIFCREQPSFATAIERQKHRRVTDFFPELDRAVFTVGRQQLCAELERITPYRRAENPSPSQSELDYSRS